MVAFPVASNAVGTLNDPRRIAELAHEAGALAWADAVHYAPHGPIDVAGLGPGRADLLAVQVLRPAPGARLRAARPARVVAPVQGAAGAVRAGRPPLRHGDDAARAARGLRRRGRAHRVARLGRDPRARARARRALPRRAPGERDAVRPADDGGPRADLRLQRRRAGARPRSRRVLGERGFARVARQLLRGRDHGAARPARRRRAGRVRPLQHRRRRSTGCSRSSRRCEAPRPRRDEVPRQARRRGGARRGPRGDALHARRDEPGPLPRGRAPARRPRRRPGRARGARVGRRRRHLRLRAARRRRVGGTARAARSSATSSSPRSRSTRTSRSRATESSPLAQRSRSRPRSSGARPTARSRRSARRRSSARFRDGRSSCGPA